jgi:hypothetical protein
VLYWHDISINNKAIVKGDIMPEPIVYKQVYELFYQTLDKKINKPTLKRLTLLVLGIIKGKSSSPLRIAKALDELGLTNATAESIERRVRRIENDDNICVTTCFHPLAKERLAYGRPRQLLLIIDPTTQEDHVVMLTVGVWYRGKALPIAWMVWPGNKPLKGGGFWQRVEILLDVVAELLPVNIPIIWLADRAFGSPAFIDLITARESCQWHYITRVVKTARYLTENQTDKGPCHKVSDLTPKHGYRSKMRGKAFKKRGWRPVSIVAYWGKGYDTPLCIVSDLPPDYRLIYLYARRYPIESLFRDYKSNGWNWEQGQVRNLEHLERLLVGMALATWVTILVGTQVAEEHLAKIPTGNRRTLPWVGKQSLFQLGLHRLQKLFMGTCQIPIQWYLTHWDALNWSKQIYFHHARAYVLGSISSFNRKEPVRCCA